MFYVVFWGPIVLNTFWAAVEELTLEAQLPGCWVAVPRSLYNTAIYRIGHLCFTGTGTFAAALTGC